MAEQFGFINLFPFIYFFSFFRLALQNESWWLWWWWFTSALSGRDERCRSLHVLYYNVQWVVVVAGRRCGSPQVSAKWIFVSFFEFSEEKKTPKQQQQKLTGLKWKMFRGAHLVAVESRPSDFQSVLFAINKREESGKRVAENSPPLNRIMTR